MNLLGRGVDPIAAATFGPALDAGLSRTTLIQMVEQSQEFKVRAIGMAYQKLLKRDPDKVAFQTFLPFLSTGGTIDGMQAAIIASPEYFSMRANSDPATFVNSVWQDLLGHPIDPKAQPIALQILASNPADRIAIANIVLKSAEYHALVVNNDYQQFLGRTSTNDPLASYWTFKLAQGKSMEDVLAGIGGSPEAFNHA
jgi:hypothetical protein